MRIVKKNVYYCDHCNKRYLSAGHMKRHETGCTANPKRRCGICFADGIGDLDTFALFLEPCPSTSPFEDDTNGVRRVIEGQYEDFIASVSDATNGCPACMLAIIRHLRLTRIPWEYSDAKAAYWAKVNEDEYERENRNVYYM